MKYHLLVGLVAGACSIDSYVDMHFHVASEAAQAKDYTKIYLPTEAFLVLLWLLQLRWAVKKHEIDDIDVLTEKT